MDFIKRNWKQGAVLALSVVATGLVAFHKITPEQYAMGAVLLAGVGVHLPPLTYRAPLSPNETREDLQ